MAKQMNPMMKDMEKHRSAMQKAMKPNCGTKPCKVDMPNGNRGIK